MWTARIRVAAAAKAPRGPGTVRVVLTKVFPYSSGYMQTIAGRRKRFRAALTEFLAARGRREVRRDVYSRKTPAGE